MPLYYAATTLRLRHGEVWQVLPRLRYAAAAADYADVTPLPRHDVFFFADAAPYADAAIDDMPLLRCRCAPLLPLRAAVACFFAPHYDTMAMPLRAAAT